MKSIKTTVSKTNAAAKFTTAAEYIAALPASTKDMVKEIRKIIKEMVPTAEEVISYNMPAFKYHGILVWYAGWKEHVSLYPRTKVMEEQIAELSAYEAAKGTIKFPANKPLPVDLIRQIVQCRIQENLDSEKVKK